VQNLYNHLIALGFYRDLVGAVTGAAVAWAAAQHPLRKLHKRLKAIENELDTSTPGGLTDVMNAVKDRNESEERT
jgi:hypothetical protein